MLAFYGCDSPVMSNNTINGTTENIVEIYGSAGALITNNFFKNSEFAAIAINALNMDEDTDKYYISNNIFINPYNNTMANPTSGTTDSYSGAVAWHGSYTKTKIFAMTGNIIIDESSSPKCEYMLNLVGDVPYFEDFIFVDNIIVGAISGPMTPALAAKATVYRHDGQNWNNKLISFAEEFDNGVSNIINFNDGQKQKLTPSGPTTYTFVNPTDGPCDLRLKLIDGLNNNPTWPSNVKWQGGVEPTWTSGTDFINFYFDGTDYWGSAGFNFS